MTTSSPNEPTEGEGGLAVYDATGRYVGRTTREPEVPSEDLARVAIQVTPDVQATFGLRGRFIDVEATWLEREGDAPTVTLTCPLEEALREEGFLV